MDIEESVFKWWLEVEFFCSNLFSIMEENTKKVWTEYFCTYMISPLNNKVKRNLIDLSKRKLGTVILSCNEAFVVYLIKKNISDWFSYCNENIK